jgi:hypothetical protein
MLCRLLSQWMLWDVSRRMPFLSIVLCLLLRERVLWDLRRLVRIVRCLYRMWNRNCDRILSQRLFFNIRDQVGHVYHASMPPARLGFIVEIAKMLHPGPALHVRLDPIAKVCRALVQDLFWLSFLFVE